MRPKISTASLTRSSVLRAWGIGLLTVGCVFLLLGASDSSESDPTVFESVKGEMVWRTWAQEVQVRLDSDAVEWAKQRHDDALCREDFVGLLKQDHAPCGPALGNEDSADESLKVLISTSMPRASLVDLSVEVEKVGGSFILSGLTNRSWKELGEWVRHLQERGVICPIQIDPRPFLEHTVSEVPTFLVVEGNRVDSLAGNVSLEWALTHMSLMGETDRASELLVRLKENIGNMRQSHISQQVAI